MILSKASFKTLSKDIRAGSEMVQSIILVVIVALTCIVAFQYFAGKVKERAQDAGDQIPKI